MSAATALALQDAPRRAFPRHPISVPLDLIALRSGIPENLPSRCTDISEAGIGAVIPGEMAPGQQVAIELRLPNVGVPVRARAQVRYQSRLHCGLEFVGLSPEQREMIRYWVFRAAEETPNFKNAKQSEVEHNQAETAFVPEPSTPPKRKVRIARSAFYVLLACVLVVAAVGWWQWQRSWTELERQTPTGKSESRISSETRPFAEESVPSETMQNRILTKFDPVYPEAARVAGTQGMVVLDAVIAADGSVQRLRPVSGADLLVRSATDAVQSWKFDPYLSSGKPIAVETTIAVDFRLN